MATAILEHRVDRLEDMMADLTANVKKLSIETHAFQQEVRAYADKTDRYIAEMRQESRAYADQTDRYIAEMRQESRAYADQTDRYIAEIRQESRAYADQTDRYIAEMRQESRAYADQTDRHIAEIRQESREMNRRWGDISNSLGMLVENIVAPSIPRVLREVLGCPEGGEHFLTVRYKHGHSDGRTREFDAIAGCGDYLLINETKSRLRPSDIDPFIEVLKTARDFLPEYAGRKIVGALASLYVDASVVAAGERRGLLMLGMTDDAMEVLNSSGFRPAVY